VTAGELRWATEGFLDQIDAWARRGSPHPDLLLIVLPWVMERSEYPYRGVRREPGFDNLWFGGIAGSEDAEGRIVVCSYWVFDELRLLRCNSVATLSAPS
jgi:hypothetical protein